MPYYCYPCPCNTHNTHKCSYQEPGQEDWPYADAYKCHCKDGWNGKDCNEPKNFFTDNHIWMVGVGAFFFVAVVAVAVHFARRRRREQQELNDLKARLLDHFPQLQGMEDVMIDGMHQFLISFDEIILGPIIGAGSSAVVMKGSYSGQMVAVKRLHPLPSSDEDFRFFFKQEASLLAKLNHPNIVRFFGISYRMPHFFIVTEFCPSTLGALLIEAQEKNIILEPNYLYHLALSVALGMSYLHGKDVIHRDLKPDNVLLTREGNVKICDFGMARLYDATHNNVQMTTRVVSEVIIEPNQKQAPRAKLNQAGVLRSCYPPASF